MTSLRRLQNRLRAWTTFRGVARATRSLAAAQTSRWTEQVTRAQTFLNVTARLVRRGEAPSVDGERPRAVLLLGTDLGLCGPLNANVAHTGVATLREPSTITVVVGQRLATLLGDLDATVLPAPTTAAAVETLGARIAALLSALPAELSDLTIVATRLVEADGRAIVERLDRAASSTERLPYAASLSPPRLTAQRAAELHRYARIVESLTRAAACETEARWRTMNRAYEAADRRIAEQERTLRQLQQELVTQEMLEARRGHRIATA